MKSELHIKQMHDKPSTIEVKRSWIIDTKKEIHATECWIKTVKCDRDIIDYDVFNIIRG